MVFCICLAYFVRRCCFPEEPTEGSFYCILDVFSIPFVKMTSSKRVSGGFILQYFTLFSICFLWGCCLPGESLESSFYCVPRVFSILIVKRLSSEESSVGSVFLCCALYVSNTSCEPEGTLFGIFCICLAYFLWRWCLPEESSEASFYCGLHTFSILFAKMLSSRRVPGGFVL